MLEDSYIIYIDDKTINAINGTTENIDFRGNDAVAVMQNAYNAIFNHGGGNLFIKSGKYPINNNPILLKAYVNIMGEGKNTMLQNNIIGGPIFKFIQDDTVGTAVYTTIEKMRFVGGGIGSGPAIQTKDAPPSGYTLTDYLVLRDLIIQNMNSYGIYMPSRVEFSTFENLIVKNNAADGIKANNTLAACKFTGCDLSENTGDGLYVTAGVGNYYHIYQASSNNNYGLEFLNETQGEVHLMYSENNSKQGLYINGSNEWVHLYNVRDGYTIASPTISYTEGYQMHIAGQI